jgi:hypothetical protein
MPASPATSSTPGWPWQAAVQRDCSGTSQRVVATDQCRRSVRLRRGRRAGWCRLASQRRADVAISTPRQRLDPARLLHVVAQRCTQFADRGLDDALSDEAVPPDFVEQLLLADDLTRPGSQAPQQIEHTRLKLDLAVTHAKQVPLGVDGHGRPGRRGRNHEGGRRSQAV